jgi:hypothetical protein
MGGWPELLLPSNTSTPAQSPEHKAAIYLYTKNH